MNEKAIVGFWNMDKANTFVFMYSIQAVVQRPKVHVMVMVLLILFLLS